jgi:diguanylate cyclase (GGDEF)-like protein
MTNAERIPLRVLIVEDSEDDALLIVRELARGGFEPAFRRVQDAAVMREALAQEPWDIVITDHNLPSFNSTAALEIAQGTGLDIPVIIVSGSIGEDVAVEAMRAGAQDYLMKDKLARLAPAVARELREVESRRARRRAQETLAYQARHDALTDLMNRAEFERRLERALADAREQGAAHCLLYLDLDQFKVVNDTCGHTAGDELLKRLAGVLREQMRDHDTLARLGGDEFGVLLEGCGLDPARRIAEGLLATIKQFHFVWEGKNFSIGASIGLVPIDAHSESVADALRQADIACYAAKDHGRNRMHVFAPDDAELASRHGEMQWVARLTEAIEQNRFCLYRQTIAALGNHAGRAPRWEFLLRLDDGRGGVIAPVTFIPAAERYNLMPAIDRWVVRAALAHLAVLTGDDAQGAFFINLSGASLSDAAFFDFLRAELEAQRILPGRVVFEITETAAITIFHDAVRFMRELRELGCRFALDDFGSGLSSFSYLRTLPVDYVKIDGQFVRAMHADPMARAIVRAANDIAHTVGLRTIAESVETGEEWRALAEIGVDYAQGYHIERPCPL